MRDDIVLAAKKLWTYHAISSELEPSDAVVGLGSYDTRVAQRAVELYKSGHHGVLVFSGHEGNWTKGKFTDTEAERFRDIAISLGVSRSDIICEKEATNIGNNLKFTAKVLEGQIVDTVVVVTKPQTQRRVLASAPIHWPGVRLLVTSPQIDFDEQYPEGLGFDHLVNELVGDTGRMVVYPRLGFQVPQDMPREVWDAFTLLAREGFDKNLESLGGLERIAEQRDS